MSAENFNTFALTDPNGVISRTSSRVSWTDLTKNEDAWLSLDKGAAFFDGSFVHLLTFSITAGDQSSSLFSALWLIANVSDSYDAARTGGALSLDFSFSGAQPRLFLNEAVGGSNLQSAAFNITLGTTYYVTIIRDETAGANGTLSCKIYSDAARTVLLDTLSRTLSAKNDFRYVYGIASFNNANGNKHTGFTQDLDLSGDTQGAAPQLLTQPPIDILATTATGGGYTTSFGLSTVTAHGVVWDTSPIDTSVVPGSQPNSTDEGAGSIGPFTSSITGLTAGTKYYYRAYATNSHGTTYGLGFSWFSGAPATVLSRGNIQVVGTHVHYSGTDGREYWVQGQPV